MSNSPFAYCANNPISRVDPFGLEWKDTNNDGIADYWWVEEPIVVTAESEEELSFDGVGERVTFMYGIFKNEGYHSLMSNYRKFRPNFELSEKFAVTGSNIAVSVIGIGTISQLYLLYGKELALLGLTSQQQVKAWVSTIGLSNARFILNTVKIKAVHISVFMHSNTLKLINNFKNAGLRVYRTSLYQYSVNQDVVNDAILGIGSGANIIDYTPHTWIGWGGYFLGNTFNKFK
jgi:hypothetical protein